jgi:crotonobetainyl-CoA:carnitine CoA-transferase CaiB-like acyl-CoA transferase
MDKTVKVQMLDVAQVDCMVSLNTVAVTSYNMLGMSMREYREKYPQARGGIGGITKTKDGYIYIAGFRPRAIEKMKQELDLEDITSDTIKELVADMTNSDALEYLLGFGIPVAEIYSVKEVVKDPHLIDRGMFTEVEHPKAGTIKVTNFPVKFSETPGEIRTATPLLGQHNEEILSTIVGYTPEQIQKLKKQGIIMTDTSV